MMLLKHLFFAVMSLSVAACSDSSPTNNSNTLLAGDLESTLANRDWVLNQFQANDGTVTTFTHDINFEFTIRFSSVEAVDGSIKHSVSGINVCNIYGGEFTLEENILKLTNMSEDDGSCERASESPAALFARVLFTTDSAPMLSIDRNRLEISSGSNERLIFTDNDAVEFTELRSGDLFSLGNNTFSQPRYQIFRNQQDFGEFYGNLVQCPCTMEGAPQINFEDSTMLFIAHEIVASGGHSIEIVNSKNVSNRLRIEIQRHAPGENCPVTDAPTGPYKFYSVVGVHEFIDFVERPTLSPPCG